jgi:antitoxin (DNA-binding transcriptional repressor) of toxin-antitoxin stability system
LTAENFDCTIKLYNQNAKLLVEQIMENIAVSVLRSKIMRVLKEVEAGSTINITSRGKVVARLVPPNFNCRIAKDRLNTLSKTAIIHDVLSPIDEAWKAEQ